MSMEDLRLPPDRRFVHFLFLAVSVVGLLYGWRWAAQIEPGDPVRADWMRVAASALPAIVAWWSSIRLRALRSNGHATGIEQTFDVLRWLALAGLAVVVLMAVR
jgi:hypothetical protein